MFSKDKLSIFELSSHQQFVHGVCKKDKKNLFLNLLKKCNNNYLIEILDKFNCYLILDLMLSISKLCDLKKYLRFVPTLRS